MPPASRGKGMGSSQSSGAVMGHKGTVIGNIGRGRGATGAHASTGTLCRSASSTQSMLLVMLGLLVMGTLWLTSRAQIRGGAVLDGESASVGQVRFKDRVDEAKELVDVGWEDGKAEAGSQLQEGPGNPGYPKGEDDIHVVFSTDCSPYQGWQAVVLFHSANLSGHTGPITQLVSGCTEEEQIELTSKHELNRHTTNHRLHFSPSFSVKHPKTGEDYPYMNKPNALLRWFNETEVLESVVALIDPDFIFLKPLTTWISPTETVVRGDGLSIEGLKLENGGWIRAGYPAGQRFGLPNWTRWERDKFCPEGTECATATTSKAKRFYDLIPPYLVHKDDWAKLLELWVDQAPKVYELFPMLLAEQTAYATAAATLSLKHYRINNFAIESEKVDYEAWDAVDYTISNVCEVGVEEADGASQKVQSFARMPHFIHYCHMYRVGHWLFNKRRYRKEEGYDQLLCETPLLEVPPMDMQKQSFKIHPGARYESISPRSAKRNAFVLCVATRFVNSALRRFKLNVCPGATANMEETMRIS